MPPLAALLCPRRLHRQLHSTLYHHFSSSSSSSSSSSPIEKILVANRGEIAIRIMRTARRLGIRTVAVYSDADRESLHVRYADEAVRIGPAQAKLSYLDKNAILEAAARTGAQAVHPGYGFLSENAEFAKLCESEGFTFIGPPSSAIRDMGDKSASKRIMGEAGVPLVPGYHGTNQDLDLMRSEAEKIGYPVLIKPTHGGGGKGMRIVQNPAEFVDSFLGAQREAAASFGVDTILLEKYITRPRHIEVQPNVSDEFRSEVGKAAVSAAKAVGYYNAGTVEFIVDTVEHPVTEMVVRKDLVEWQIRVANGEPLPVSQEEVQLSGHAFEARIYAENVPKGFLPATGVLHYYRPVPVSETVRLETGVGQGDAVSMHYDPMIAKLVVWGESRAAALIAGLPTNIDFLLKLSCHHAFESGQVETHFIDHYKDELFPNSSDTLKAEKGFQDAQLSAVLVAACLCKRENAIVKENLHGAASRLSIWYSEVPFRVNHCAQRNFELEWENEYDEGAAVTVKLIVHYQQDGSYLIKSASEDSGSAGGKFRVTQLNEHDFRVEVDGSTSTVSLAVYSKGPIEHLHIWHGSQHHQFRQKVGLELSGEDEVQDKRSHTEASSHSPGTVVTPMAGLVVKVLFEDGAKVEAGQPVLVLEAMKMEHIVKAPSSGFIRGLQATPGKQVSDGSVLFKIQIELHTWYSRFQDILVDLKFAGGLSRTPLRKSTDLSNSDEY
ncbi:Methylcrotonoyl-CoA carboxylase subunit alpha, mitochondrial-like protein [Drosera capensis]